MTTKRGRPTAPERAERLGRVLAAAAASFVEVGYHATTLDAVAEAAGVTKRTVYAYVGDKPALLHEVVWHQHAYQDVPAPDPRAAGVAVCRALFGDRAIGLQRAVLAVAYEQPEIAADFYATGPEAAQRWLAGHLDGDLVRAERLFTLLLGEPHRRRLLGLEPAPTEEWIDRHVAAVLAG